MALSKAQLAARVGACGGSDVAALAGLSRWRSPIDVYRDQIEGVDPDSPSLAAKLGDLMEEPIAKMAAEQLGLYFCKVGTLRDDRYRYAIVTPDRAAFTSRELAGDPRRKVTDRAVLSKAVRLVEVKHTTMRLRYEWGLPESADVAPYFYPQAIWQCALTGLPSVTFAVLFDKNEFSLFHVPADPAMFAALYEITERFFVDHVLPAKPPPPDASDRYTDFLNQRFSSAPQKKVDPADAQLEEKILQWAQLKAVSARVKKAAALVANEVRLAIGERYGVTSPSFGKVLWIRKKNSNVIDWKAAHTDLINLAGLIAKAPTEPERLELLAQCHQVLAVRTTSRPNAATLRGYWKGDALELERQTLALELPPLALPEGEQSNEEDEEEKPEK